MYFNDYKAAQTSQYNANIPDQARLTTDLGLQLERKIPDIHM